eukprot:6112067-Heterocapsa_arctica.AAC.1
MPWRDWPGDPLEADKLETMPVACQPGSSRNSGPERSGNPTLPMEGAPEAATGLAAASLEGAGAGPAS